MLVQSAEWADPQAGDDMNELLRVRGVVLSLLEKARGQKWVFGSVSGRHSTLEFTDASKVPWRLKLTFLFLVTLVEAIDFWTCYNERVSISLPECALDL